MPSEKIRFPCCYTQAERPVVAATGWIAAFILLRLLATIRDSRIQALTTIAFPVLDGGAPPILLQMKRKSKTFCLALIVFLAFAAVAGYFFWQRQLEPPVIRELRARGNILTVEGPAPGLDSPGYSSYPTLSEFDGPQPHIWRNDQVREIMFTETHDVAPLVKHARSLSNLKKLTFFRGAVDSTEIAEFEKLLPDCEVVVLPFHANP